MTWRSRTAERLACSPTTSTWAKIDVATFSWQKVLGGEGAHGVLILGPRAAERLESYTPAWPLPKLFRLVSKGKLTEGVFKGETINTPSMLAVEDAIFALEWAKGLGEGGLIARSDANAAALDAIVGARDWLGHLAADPAARSKTSVCPDRRGRGRSVHQGDGRCSGEGRRGVRRGGLPRCAAGGCVSGAARPWTPRISWALGPWLDWAYSVAKVA